MKKNLKFSVRVLYLYLFSFIGLFIVTIALIGAVDLFLKVTIFTEADRHTYYDYPVAKMEGEGAVSEEEREMRAEKELVRSRQRELSNSISMLAVGVPLYLYHWKTIKKENA